MDNLTFILYSIVYMTDDSIWTFPAICSIVKARKGLKSLSTMLEESNETIVQMKDAMYFSFKELQLNMDYIFCIAIRSNITLHDPFLRIIIWITRLLYCLNFVQHLD